MPPLAGLMFFCSRYSSVTVLDSQYPRHALFSCCASICTPPHTLPLADWYVWLSQLKQTELEGQLVLSQFSALS